MESTLGYDREKVDRQKVVRIIVSREVYRDVTVVYENPELDLAVVRMDEPLDSRTPLKIDFNPPEIASPCYALYIEQLIDPYDDPDTFYDAKIIQWSGSQTVQVRKRRLHQPYLKGRFRSTSA